jgi:hypothetical protein
MAVKQIIFQEVARFDAIKRSIFDELNLFKVLKHPHVIEYYGTEVCLMLGKAHERFIATSYSFSWSTARFRLTFCCNAAGCSRKILQGHSLHRSSKRLSSSMENVSCIGKLVISACYSSDLKPSNILVRAF